MEDITRPPGHNNSCRKYIRNSFIILLGICTFCFLLGNFELSTPMGTSYLRNMTIPYHYIKQVFNNIMVTTPKPHINPHDFAYLITEEKICDAKHNNKTVYLMVVVCVAPGNFEKRQTIRETWGSVAKTHKEMQLVFLLGSTNDNETQLKIINESRNFHDIVQEDFVDSYRNLSLKSAALLKWSSTYCSSARYVLKADDDMFVNLEYLIGVLKHRNLSNAVIGMQITGARPIQNKNSKWYTPPDSFNGSVYPPYCSGTSYVISGDSTKKLYLTSLDIPYFWLEDVYITGICREKAKVRLFNDNGFTYDKPSASGCIFKRRITGHRYSEVEIRKIWKEFTDKSLKCNIK